MELTFRRDIDGLRGFAVLIVVGFHAFPDLIKGGFIGVDIFFVISGFLISRIIINELENGSFSFLNFYSRRIRRIFPALITVLCSVGIVGWFLMFPSEFKSLSKHISAGGMFGSNIILWNESGYFDTNSDYKPLLHLWSLGVEEQFYILFPFCLWFAYKYKLNLLKFLLLTSLTSFLINIILMKFNPVFTFYSPFTRLWELLSGALVSVGRSYKLAHENSLNIIFWKRKKNIVLNSINPVYFVVIGLLSIGLGLFYCDKNIVFPGYYGLFPVLGTSLIIYFGPDLHINKFLFSNTVIVFFGKISYPLYLWHWPILVFSSLYSGHDLIIEFKILTLCLSTIISWVTYRFIETPIRYGLNYNRNSIILIVVMVIVATLGYLNFKRNIFLTWFLLNNSYNKVVSDLTLAHDFELNKWLNPETAVMCFQLPSPYDVLRSDFFLKNGCLNRASDKKNVLLIGDSHSASLSLGLRIWAPKNNINLLQVSGYYGLGLYCFRKPGDPNPCGESDDYSAPIERDIKAANADIIIFDMYWAQKSSVQHFGSIQQQIQHIIDQVQITAERYGIKDIIIVGQAPIWKGGLPEQLLNNFVYNRLIIPDRIKPDSLNGFESLDNYMSQVKYPANIKYFSLRGVLCDSDGCLTHIGNNLIKDVTSWDESHLTESAASYVVDHGLGSLIIEQLYKNDQ